MAEIRSKSALAVELSKLEGFGEHKAKLEQYTTPSETAADIVWEATLRGHIKGKVILDAGCGTGIFGLGALLMGAEKVFFVDVDKKALLIAETNYKKLKDSYEVGKAVFIDDKIEDFEEEVSIVLQNPPFGTKEKHADKIFLEKAFSVSKAVYSLHKLSTQKFVESIAKDYGFKAVLLHKIFFPIKATLRFHRKKKYDVKVGVWLLEKA